MDSKFEERLIVDFRRWSELVDFSAHAENEVERKGPALKAVALERKWMAVAADAWNDMRNHALK